MKDLINSIIKNQVNKYFEFELTEGNSVKKLKKATKLVPNLSGIYLVFSEGLNESTHLNFKISNKNYSLLYYGKAGGKTNSGRVIVQGLNSRINNVVSDSKRGMKDVKRAKYWNEIMLEFGIEKLYVVFHIHDAPQQLENIIYDYLDSNNLEYPLMNKKRGRLSKKNKSEILKKNDNVSVSTKISKQIKKTKNLISKPIKLQNSNSKESVYGSCVEFQLARNQNIATIANGISNLHVGPCSIELFYKNSNDVRLYINNGKRNIRTKNRTISEYFNSPDTKNGNIPKWQIVQNEMNEPNRKIEEITVRVCSNVNTTESSNITINKKSSKSKKTNKKDNSTFNQKNEFTKLLNSLNLDKLKNDNRPKLLIISCSKSKKVGGNNEFYSMFNLNPSRENSIHLYNDLLNNNPNYFENEKRVNINDVNSNYFNSAFNLNLCMRAIDRYDSGKSAFYSNYGLKNIYLQKINNNKLHLLIISGLYGLLNYEDFIPDYHFQMSKNPNWKNSLDFSIHNAVKEYINQNNIPDENVFYSLANNEYRKALKPNKNWKLLWLNNKSGSPKNSAKFIAQEFLPRL